MATEHLTAARVRSVGAPGAFQWPAALIFWGLGFGSAGPRHSHNSVVAMALKSRFRIRGGPSRPWIVCRLPLAPDAIPLAAVSTSSGGRDV
jgi:hypothetical protein